MLSHSSFPLRSGPNLNKSRILELITTTDQSEISALLHEARSITDQIFGKRVYFRGLIEFTNYCKNNCYYCGIRHDNAHIDRYRLTHSQILKCCEIGHTLGYRTFVLQGGEDPYFTDDRMVPIVRDIRQFFPDCAITLSLGERGRASFQRLFDAGANRYLLRHETANESHYRKLHHASMSLRERKQCLYDLRAIGYQVGAGFMVGTPFQTPEHLFEDLAFLNELKPNMIGIGPFLPQSDTPFNGCQKGSGELTLKMIAMTRILFPKVLLPSTTALGTLIPGGRELGLTAGANVVMPNLSPTNVRKMYALYDDKICTGDEAAECRHCLGGKITKSGFQADFGRGDFPGWQNRKLSSK
jgi:biotin synthase